eukprot:3396-Heterococcus_DN1.PRE.2
MQRSDGHTVMVQCYSIFVLVHFHCVSAAAAGTAVHAFKLPLYTNLSLQCVITHTAATTCTAAATTVCALLRLLQVRQCACATAAATVTIYALCAGCYVQVYQASQLGKGTVIMLLLLDHKKPLRSRCASRFQSRR